jgi:hypothetical protein
MPPEREIGGPARLFSNTDQSNLGFRHPHHHEITEAEGAIAA